MGAWRRLLVVGALVWALPGSAEPFREALHVDGSTLVVQNLVGQVRIEKGSGAGFDVVVDVAGRDATRERVTIQQDRTDGAPSVRIAFPLDEERRYVYPEMARRSRVSFTYEPGETRSESVLGSVLRKLRGKQVRVSGSGSGLELWADVTVKVPEGATFTLDHGVGAIFVTEVNGTFEVHTHHGTLDAERVAGSLTADTGNGDVQLDACSGRARVDTGNGDVDIRRFDGEQLSVDTGNGHVYGEGVRSTEVLVDTGNGRIQLLDVVAGSARLDTGNGAVELALTEMGDGPFLLDSGNGSLTLSLPRDASAEVAAETGRGRVHVDVANATMDMRDRDRDRREAHFRVGDGRARVQLDTGNGSVRIEG